MLFHNYDLLSSVCPRHRVFLTPGLQVGVTPSSHFMPFSILLYRRADTLVFFLLYDLVLFAALVDSWADTVINPAHDSRAISALVCYRG